MIYFKAKRLPFIRIDLQYEFPHKVSWPSFKIFKAFFIIWNDGCFVFVFLSLFLLFCFVFNLHFSATKNQAIFKEKSSSKCSKQFYTQFSLHNLKTGSENILFCLDIEIIETIYCNYSWLHISLFHIVYNKVTALNRFLELLDKLVCCLLANYAVVLFQCLFCSEKMICRKLKSKVIPRRYQKSIPDKRSPRCISWTPWIWFPKLEICFKIHAYFLMKKHSICKNLFFLTGWSYRLVNKKKIIAVLLWL